ncbi:MAG: copper amine oxidase N-terminal domain-containing protein [Eubacterium sp.]|nr:copper amine oxidase N-terminal domain-containing protein [Eubacterium sp.]
MKKFIAALIILVMFCVNVYGNIEHSSEIFVDEKSEEVSYAVTLASGEIVDIEENSAFILKNGEPVYTVPYKECDGNIIFEVRKLFETMNYEVLWEPESKTVYISDGKSTENFDYGEYVLINDKAYMGTEKFNGVFGYCCEVKNYPFDIDDDYMYFCCPLIVFDSFDTKTVISENTQFSEVKEWFQAAFEDFKENSEYCDGSENAESVLKLISERINGMEQIGEISKYRIYDGPYRVYADKTSGEMYYEISKIHRSIIKKLVYDDSDLFVINYFVG